MGFPAPADELALHERVLAGDPVAPADVFRALMDAMSAAVKNDLRCEIDIAYDSSVDAILAYLEQPERFDRSRGRLCTYITHIAKCRAIDRLRSHGKARQRDKSFAKVVELHHAEPNDALEREVMAKELWEQIEKAVPSERDKTALRMVLAGESSTAALADALGIGGLPALAQRREVKQHRDRLLKILERLGARLSYEDA